MTDRERVLLRLQEGPVHSTELRREGYTGNPSQRINELREMGFEIKAEPMVWTDHNGKQRNGALYTLTSEPGPGLGAGTADERPREPLAGASAVGGQAASAEPETEAPSLFELPSYMDPDAFEDAA